LTTKGTFLWSLEEIGLAVYEEMSFKVKVYGQTSVEKRSQKLTMSQVTGDLKTPSNTIKPFSLKYDLQPFRTNASICSLKRNLIICIFIALLQSFDIVAIKVTKVDFYDIIEVPGFNFYSIKYKLKFIKYMFTQSIARY
jgi:hypothetical protein